MSPGAHGEEKHVVVDGNRIVSVEASGADTGAGGGDGATNPPAALHAVR